MSMFLNKFEQEISDEYTRQGYVIRPAADPEALEKIRSTVIRLIADSIGIKEDNDADHILNFIHSSIPVKELNNFRLKIIREINNQEDFREMYFRIARQYLEALVGNELAMQLRVNLSIQFPNDASSLLPVHADTWSGDSPFEVVVWLPLVDCFRTKSMYILPPLPAARLRQSFSRLAGNSSEDLFQSIQGEVRWLELRYGEILIFDQGLPHGNRINQESETRWSMNCRFKGVFTPYGDKKIGEFFEPVTLRTVSRAGMEYQFPEIS